MRQRGFVQAEGCAENILLLNNVIGMCKRNKKTLAVVFIDFAKAFHTVTHKHLWAVLEERGVDGHIVKLLKSLYQDCWTRINNKSGSTKKIGMKVGVKQGAP